MHQFHAWSSACVEHQWAVNIVNSAYFNCCELFFFLSSVCQCPRWCYGSCSSGAKCRKFIHLTENVCVAIVSVITSYLKFPDWCLHGPACAFRLPLLGFADAVRRYKALYRLPKEKKWKGKVGNVKDLWETSRERGEKNAYCERNDTGNMNIFMHCCVVPIYKSQKAVSSIKLIIHIVALCDSWVIRTNTAYI